MMLEGKSMDEVLRFAFEQGVAFGAGYPDVTAIPEDEQELRYRATRDALAGNPWQVGDWIEKREAMMLKRNLRHAETEAGLW